MKKKLVIVGGPNGVGKTTFAYQFREESGIDYLGADAIATEIKGEKGVTMILDEEFYKIFKEISK